MHRPPGPADHEGQPEEVRVFALVRTRSCSSACRPGANRRPTRNRGSGPSSNHRHRHRIEPAGR